MNTKKKWNIYLIQHSHTDIGYTERQDKIMRYHYDFIRQAMDILDGIHSGKITGADGFVWQCENYWQVENFYEIADEASRKKFETYVKSGEIGLSGNYLNMTELVSMPVLEHAIEKAQQYGKAIGHPITAGMCADINGMAWGYADALYDYGIRDFYSCLHPHHGMFPLYKKALPFYWESPKGNQMLVWNGDHYHLGNEMFLAPHGGTTYMINDEFSPGIRKNFILNQSTEDTYETEMKIVKTRIQRYLDNLNEEGYPYDIVPFMVSGAITDNAPPSAGIARRVNELNKIYKDRISFRMVTLEQFFDAVRKHCSDIPVFRGDWTDWWADGIGSTPAEVKVYRDAMRKYDLCRKLDPHGLLGNQKLMEKTAKEQMLYAEHTWGYSSSVSEPWESLVGMLELKKSAYAANSNTHAAKNLDQILAAKGEVAIRQDKPQRYLVINPHDVELHTKACLYIEFWEYIQGVRYDETIPIWVVDCETGQTVPSQVKRIARATQVEIEIAMKPKEEKLVMITLDERKYQTTENHAHIGAEGIEDLLSEKDNRVDADRIETDHIILTLDGEKGITSIINKADHTELIRDDSVDGAFAGVYEVTDMVESACETRRRMGRNRKSTATRRYRSMLKDRRIVENGTVYAAVELDYQLEGTGFYTVYVKAYKHQPKLEVMVRVHKQSVWEPENLYVALPFTAGEDTTVYFDKTGCIIRPGIDQLPGSCQDFYLIQNGVVLKSDTINLAIITKDAPLISLGGLEARPIVLCDCEDEGRNRSPLYSWVMNNYWETNFKVNLGGFYEFFYTLMVHEPCGKAEIYAVCEAENEGLIACYTD
ncbi:MAG TPA: glycosyl hydrolase [Lachnoclostridium sp.]|uniref:glycoside hydrolase family 38 N-terminal domain-containing protein n=1 Tax=Lacrimispora sp. TaxID=2719234 RepID=UPI000ECF8D4B|nr:glycoside hydrolase family 38 C-terminal domain-containing protein [Lacrimispora sp.]HCD46386.1 glycosyl hydrolase [Lachnoclostridium sp.]